LAGQAPLDNDEIWTSDSVRRAIAISREPMTLLSPQAA
jgi:hypothetical protein